MAKRKRTRKPLTPEQLRKLEEGAFSRKIQGTFKNAGFLYLPTVKMGTVQFGLQAGDLDGVLIYENIILLYEETISGYAHITDHLKKTKNFYDDVRKNEAKLIKWLKENFADKFNEFDEYIDSEYHIYYLYFTKQKFNPTDDQKLHYAPIKIVENSSLNYMQELAKNIRYSSRSEIYRFLDLKKNEVGGSDSSEQDNKIVANIIYPQQYTGLDNGIRMVSFMMSAEKLMANCYVLRKDSWEESMEFYQRLIKKQRITNIRKYLATKKRTFFNNIIVSLPDEVYFLDKQTNKQLSIDQIKDAGDYKLVLPDEFNTICVIDGQHRVFAHFHGEDNLDKKIRPLRKKLHLLVTGLIYPTTMSYTDRIKYESEIFLDINDNAKKVSADLLLFIQTLRDPFSDYGVARRVLVRLNQRNPFRNLLELSSTEPAKIKVASIIKYALRSPVAITDSARKDNLYYYWVRETGKDLVNNKDKDTLDEYIDYVVRKLGEYFVALKDVFEEEWASNDSKILSTITINGFIMAYQHYIEINGVDHGIQQYREAFQKLKSITFTKADFPYTSSQYRKFSKLILDECFGIKKED